jgi:hypothetical protein
MSTITIDYIIIGVNLFIFVIAPFLPNIVYTHFVETYLGITVLLIASLYSITYGYLASVSAFIGIASLYSESHARKTATIKVTPKNNSTNEFENQLNSAPELIPNEIHPEIESPDNDIVKTVPGKDDGNNKFKEVDYSINEKRDLPTVSNTKEAENIYIKDNLAEYETKE